jgi:hypothetical protein
LRESTEASATGADHGSDGISDEVCASGGDEGRRDAAANETPVLS